MKLIPLINIACIACGFILMIAGKADWAAVAYSFPCGACFATSLQQLNEN